MFTDTIHMMILFFVATAFSTFRKKPLEITTRSVIYSIVLSLTFIVLLNSFIKIENRFYLTPAEMGIPTALIFAMALCFFDSRPTITSIILILSVFALMMNGDIDKSHEVIKLPLPQSFGKLENIRIIYLVSFLLVSPSFYYLMNRSQNRLKTVQQGSLKWKTLKISLIISAIIATSFLYFPVINTAVPMSRDFESKIIQLATKYRFNRTRSAFNDKITLKNSYLLNNLDLDKVLIRVKSGKTPGYLRSRIYNTYEKGSWKSEEKPTIMNLLSTDEDQYTHSTYSFNGLEQEDKKNFDVMEVYYSSDFRVNTVLHKGKSRYLEMTCEALNQTDSATVTGKVMDYSGGVTLYNEKGSSEEDSYESPIVTTENSGTYLQVPSLKMVNELNEVFFDIDRTDANTVAAGIIKYFQDNKFEYSLNAKLDYRKGPISAFLEKKVGHCELYATTSVMALRSKGIPARYVTGFFCSEQHPNGEYYVGRSMDLHAWVEYYDNTSSKWRIMEPTPAGFMPGDRSKFGSFEANWDSAKNQWQKFMASIVRGFFAESVLIFLTNIFHLFLWLFNTPIKAFISLSILIYIYLKRRKKKKGKTQEKDVLTLQKDLHKLMKRVEALKDYESKPSTTLREIISFLEKRKDSTSTEYADCLKNYENYRYNTSGRSSEKFSNVQNCFKKALQSRIS